MNEIDKALITWYPLDNPLHFDPLHPAIGLAGEAGEILDLYKKEKFKEGFSWWDCVCGHTNHHNRMCGWFTVTDNSSFNCACLDYTPKILDELGDLWYYLRILAYQSNIELFTLDSNISNNIFTSLVRLNYHCSFILARLDKNNEIPFLHLRLTYKWLQMILRQLDCTLDQLTELNWQKLKDGDNHGWKTTRESTLVNQQD